MKIFAREILGIAKEVVAWGSRMSLPRSFYLKQREGVSDMKQYPTDPELDLEIWTYTNAQGYPAGIAFWGKSNKPLWNFYYRNQAELDKKIQGTIETRKSHIERVQQQRQERREYKHGLKEGDIMYSSWGYDQTNIDFYQVVEAGEKSVKIRKIGQKTVSSATTSDNVVAVPNSFQGPPMTKIVKPGDVVSIASYANAYKWDGEPKYQTGFGFGH